MHLPIQINIEVKGKEELDAIVDYLKSNSHGEPIFIIQYENSYRINFNSDDTYSGLLKHLRDAFKHYTIKDDIRVGVTDVRICISQLQFSTNTDYWVQPPTMATSTKYFISESAENKRQQVCPEFQVLQNGQMETYISKVGSTGNMAYEEYHAYRQSEDGGLIQVSQRGSRDEFDAFWRAVVQVKNELYKKAVAEKWQNGQ